jgi:N-acetylglucosaminyl-diphospho-decaprenol L-rhamnosyltransferase
MAAELPPHAARVAVVTVSYGSEEVLDPFLSSLADAAHEPVLVVVADNKPSTVVEGLVREHGADYLPLPGNPGYGGGVNAAAALLPASIEWVLVSNPDIRWRAGSIDSLLATARSDARIGSVGPMVLNDDGTVYPSARAVPSLRTGVGHALFANVWLGNPWTRAYRAEHADPDVARDAGWLSGSCVLVRRSAFDELGGFDEGYFMYFEDVDLAERLGRRGWLHVYAPTAVVVHEGGHATSRDAHRMQRVHHTSAMRYLAGQYPDRRHAPLRLALRAGLGARMLVSYVSGRVGAGAQPQQTVEDLPRPRRRWRRR